MRFATYKLVFEYHSNLFAITNLFLNIMFLLSIVESVSLDQGKSFHTKIYDNVFSFSSRFSQGWFRPIKNLGSIATISRAIRDVEDDTSRNKLDSFLLLRNDNSETSHDLVPLSSGNPDASTFSLMDISPSGNWTVLVKPVKDENSIIEISKRDGSINYRVDGSKVHGKVIGDAWFGGCTWTTDEKFVAYVASKKESKRGTYFADDIEDASKGQHFEAIDDWGEKYTGVTTLVICILDIQSGRIHCIDGPSDLLSEWTIGQPAWCPSPAADSASPSSYILAYTAWTSLTSASTRRLGMIHCYQRPCKIFTVDVTSLICPKADLSEAPASPILHRCITPSLFSARSPRFSPTGGSLIFLGRKYETLNHDTSSQLFRSSLQPLEPPVDPEVIVDIVNTPTLALPEGFPGLFCDLLPKQCFISNEASQEIILLKSLWGVRQSILAVNLQTKSITKLNGLTSSSSTSASTRIDEHSVNILDITTSKDNDNSISAVNVLYDESSPVHPPTLRVLQLSTTDILQINNTSNSNEATPPATTNAIHHYTVPSSQVLANSIVPNIKITTIKSKPKEKNEKKEEEKATNQSKQTSTSFTPEVDLSLTLPRLKWEILTLEVNDPKRGKLLVESILVYPERYDVHGSLRSLPLIVSPHGGPHACYTTMFLASPAFLCASLQAGVLLVNFRGSTGFGQAVVDALPGHVGEKDVRDTIAVMELALALEAPGGGKLFDRERVGVVGGSHGGFLAAHLIGQYPEVFKAAAMRNPVTDIASMVCATDIPDWCAAVIRDIQEHTVPQQEPLEASPATFSSFDPIALHDEENMRIMRSRSPVAHIRRVATPTLMLIGGKDRRVPPSQGIHYHHLLSARGIPTKLMIFPEDGHALDRPKTEADQWIAVSLWLEEHLK